MGKVCTQLKKLGIHLMKSVLNPAVGILLFCSTSLVWGGTGTIIQPPEATGYTITVQDANSRVWGRTDYEIDPSGALVPRKHSYTELASGLNHYVNGQWVESSEKIEILPNGTAAATDGQHQAYFPGDIYQGQIELVTPDGKHLKSRPLALAYFDGTKTVVIAELTNSIGVVSGNNQVIYPNAFRGFKVDLRYSYTKAGFSQDIILRTQPPTPESLGLNGDSARLQIMTEFFSAPQPTITSTALPTQAGVSLDDESLDFGTMQMVPGRAFLMGQDTQGAGAMVSKHWLIVNGRQVLIEEVPVDAILEGLAALPLTAMNSGTVKHSHTASKAFTLPPSRPVKNDNARTMMLAEASRPTQGFVLDYQAVSGTLSNYTFKADTTYYISAAVNLIGTNNTFEGGAVIKYTNNASINASYPAQINCQASVYRPVIFTAKDDNSVGDAITGSTGNPTNYYANPALTLGGTGSGPYSLSYFHFAWAKQVISSTYATVKLYDGQMINCLNGTTSLYGSIYLRNMLLVNVQTNCVINLSGVDAQNTTFSGGSNLVVCSSGGGFASTNCIFANVGRLTNSGFAGTLSGSQNGFYNAQKFGSLAVTNNFYPFQTVGGGSYYLATACAFTNGGTTNIDSTLLANLRQKTTYPPVSFTNVSFSTAIDFSPQALRDTNLPYVDLGYHYEPIDYAFGGCIAYSNFTFTAGTVVGWFRTTSGWMHAGYGIDMSTNVTVQFAGTVTAPDYWVRLNTVQEQDYTAGYGQGGIESQTSTNIPIVSGNFLRCSAMAGEQRSYFSDDYGYIHAIMVNSEFWGGSLDGYGDILYYTNCLMQRVDMELWNGNTTGNLTLRNCTFFGGNFSMQRTVGGALPISVRDSAFDGTSISTGDYYATNSNVSDYNYNAYTNRSDPFSIGGSHDVIMTNGFTWQSSWFGNYYEPTNSLMINKGDTNANFLGLYHFTTQTNQVKETNSIVDIGYHYVAANTNGLPDDTDWDGIPDYLEDLNGNGFFDPGLGSGENNWRFNGPFRGVDNNVYALADDSAGDVYAGGDLLFAGNTNANHIAVWNPNTQIWSPLYQTPVSNGEQGFGGGPVRAIVIGANGFIYVGGSGGADTGNGEPAVNIAYWNPANLTWYSMGDSGVFGPTAEDGGGIDAEVNGICVTSNNVFVVGAFEFVQQPAGFPRAIAVTNIAVWNSPSNAWFAVNPPPGIGILNAIASDGGTNVYVGGNGIIAKGQISGGNITWSWSTNINGSCTSIAVTSSNVFFGGGFVFGINDVGVLRWNGSSLIALPNPQILPTPFPVYSLCIANNKLYIGGQFAMNITSIGPTASNVVGYDLGSSNYFTLGTGNVGVSGQDYALANFGADIYSGGTFASVGDGECALRVADWNATANAWYPLIANLPPTAAITSPADGTVYPTHPATITILADAQDDCTVTKVDFYQGSSLLGTVTTPPYTFTWNSVPASTNHLSVKATDNDGATTISSTITVIVN